jgi:hypothetical protein
MQLTDDQYVIKWGDKTKVMSRSASKERLHAGQKKKDREDPGWRKRCHKSAEWSDEDRKQFGELMKKNWNSPEYAHLRQAAAERIKRIAFTPRSQEQREAHSMRMLMGGSKKAVSARKIMQPEAVAEREERNASIVRNYYRGKMKATDIAKLYKLDLSHVYKIIREVELD